MWGLYVIQGILYMTVPLPICEPEEDTTLTGLFNVPLKAANCSLSSWGNQGCVIHNYKGTQGAYYKVSRKTSRMARFLKYNRVYSPPRYRYYQFISVVDGDKVVQTFRFKCLERHFNIRSIIWN